MKTLIKIFICLSLIYTPMFANAANVGGWNLSNSVAQGASTVYDATKNVLINGKDFVKKSTVKITPTSSQVSKVLRGGVAGYALSVAVEQLLGAVDWVLDPANNQIKYTDPNTANPDAFPMVWVSNGLVRTFAASPSASCSLAQTLYYGVPTSGPKSAYQNSTGTWICPSESTQQLMNIKQVANPNYDPQAEQEQKTIPLETVAQQVISNAEGNTDKKAGAQVATGAAAADIVAEAEADQTGVKARPIVDQLTGSASTKPADEAAAAQDATATGTAQPKADPVTGEAAPPTDIALKFPMLCGLMPVVCEAAQVVVVRVPEAIEAVKEWVKPEEPVEKETKVDVEPSPVAPSETNYLQWNAYCPFSAKSDDISLNGENSTLSSDLTSWCTMASEIKPFVLLAGALASLMIVSGVGLGRSED